MSTQHTPGTEAIAFAEFISGEGWQQYDGVERWICPHVSKKVLTTEQLYQLFKSQKAISKATGEKEKVG